MKNYYFKNLFYSLILFISGIYSQAQSNQYLHFDGVNDYTELPNGAQFVNGLNTITMAGWFYTDELIYGQGMMSIRGGGTGTGEMYLIQLSDGVIECRVVTSTGLHQVVAPAGSIQAGVWQHIAWVFNQTSVELFIDGVSIGSSSASGTFISSDRPFSVGKCIQSGFNFIFKGRADEVSLWSKALSQVEIQNMIANELNGDETNLEVYYKFNQGSPGGNNTNISELLDISGDSNKNSILHDFALTGETSNFNGTLDASFQAINFSQVSTKLTTDPPFVLEATVNSGLPITYEIVSGPASLSGDTVTLSGGPGEVTVKASQPGNGTYDPAMDVYVSFDVVDASLIMVDTEVLHPLSGDVRASSLTPIKVAVRASIAYPELFSINSLDVEIEGVSVTLTNHQNGFYTGWWTPIAYGNQNIEIMSSNNFGYSNTTNQSFNLVNQSTTTNAVAMDEVWVNADFPSKTVEADLPSFVSGYSSIMGTLTIGCPPGGCDPWDRVSHVEVQGKDGEWYEIIRYLTPYGVSCQSQIDLTDFRSLLQGKTQFRVSLGTQGNGFTYTLDLVYQGGSMDYPYSQVEKLWYQTYQFGDLANLQPAEHFVVNLSENTQDAKLKLVSSGHGWGDNNTGNAAEFHNDTHHIWVDNQETFSQNNWNVCNPNPDGCSPQNGTWYYNRAGWCPGSIAQFFDFDMGTYAGQSNVELDYKFDEDYVDYCHPNNPACITGTTCNDCNDGFNPHLIVSSYLITSGDQPLELLSVEENQIAANFSLYPNPSTGVFYIELDAKTNANNIEIYDYLGRLVYSYSMKNGEKLAKLNISSQANGVYIVKVKNNSETVAVKKIIKE